MKITKKQFFADVRHEIDMLRKHATNDEKSNLDFETFSPTTPHACIYGQLTGTCTSDRAKELMDLACIRVMDLPLEEIEGTESTRLKFEDKAFRINGEYKSELTWKKYCWARDYRYMSALEGYIYLEDANCAGVISYIKGETETLTL